jgi:hypothetical protein
MLSVVCCLLSTVCHLSTALVTPASRCLFVCTLVCSLWSVVCCLLSTVYCLLSVLCYLLSIVCCLLSAIYCPSSVVCCLLSTVRCLFFCLVLNPCRGQVLVPTRELALQVRGVAGSLESLFALRCLAIYGGSRSLAALHTNNMIILNLGHT